nr:MAG TPA: baseplate protein [Caudoviricetes sp.]
MSVENTSPAIYFENTTWELISQNRVLMGAGDGHNGRDTVEAGLPNITGRVSYVASGYGAANSTTTGAFCNDDWYKDGDMGYTANGSGGTLIEGLKIDASRSNSIYGNSDTVQPAAFYVYMWRRAS